MTPGIAPPAQNLQVSPDSDRRVFWRATLFGSLLFLAVFPFIPTVGPVYRIFSIPSNSMAPTIQLGQYVLASRAAYGYSRYSFDLFKLPILGRWLARSPKRSDIVVFRLPRDPGTFFVKRIVGLPGERVQMIDGRLWINGEIVRRDPSAAIPDPFGIKATVTAHIETLPGSAPHKIIESEGDAGFLDNTSVFEVPVGHYFVMGDNRDNSVDSRIPADKTGVGYVPADLIVGPVITSF